MVINTTRLAQKPYLYHMFRVLPQNFPGQWLESGVT